MSSGKSLNVEARAWTPGSWNPQPSPSAAAAVADPVSGTFASLGESCVNFFLYFNLLHRSRLPTMQTNTDKTIPFRIKEVLSNNNSNNSKCTLLK